MLNLFIHLHLNITLIQQLFVFVLKISSAYDVSIFVYFKFSNANQANSIMDPNIMNPDLTSPKGYSRKKYLEGEEGTFIFTPPPMEFNFHRHRPPM